MGRPAESHCQSCDRCPARSVRHYIAEAWKELGLFRRARAAGAGGREDAESSRRAVRGHTADAAGAYFAARKRGCGRVK